MSPKITPSLLGSFSLPSQRLESQPLAPLDKRQMSGPFEEKSSIREWKDSDTTHFRSPLPASQSAFSYRRQDSEPHAWQDIDSPFFPPQPPRSPAAGSAPAGGDHSEPHAWQEIDSPYPPPELPKSQSAGASKEKKDEVHSKPLPSVPTGLRKLPGRNLKLEYSDSQ